MHHPLLTVSAIRIMLPFGFGYMLSYFSRNITAILAEDFSMEFAISANSLGLLTSAYFLAFALCQLPLGVLLDRFSPARTEATFLSLAALGALLSALAESPVMLSAGRIMMGFGVSACLMASYRAIIDFFPRHQIPFLNSCIFVFGGLGALFSGWPPTAGFVESFGWRNLFFLLAAGFVLCIVLLVFVVPLPDRVKNPDSRQSVSPGLLLGIVKIATSRHFWHIMPTAAILQGVMLAINGLWIVPWLMHTDGFTLEQSTTLLVFVSVAMVVGQLLAGWLGTQAGGTIAALRKLFLIGAVISAVSILAISTRPNVPTMMLWLSFTLFAPFTMLAYPLLIQKFPPEYAGRVITLLNCMIFLCAFLFQWMIGAIIGAIPSNSLEVDMFRFQLAFGVPAVLCLLAVLSMLIIEAFSEEGV